MDEPGRSGWIQGAVVAALLATGAVASTAVAASAWLQVRDAPETIEVTGSAKRRIVSDLIEWDAYLSATAADRAAAYRALAGHVSQTTAYLREHGVQDAEIRVSSVSIEPTWQTTYTPIGEEVIREQERTGYRAGQRITVVSGDVDLVERLSREVTELLDADVPIESGAPSYHYTEIGELKVQMLAEASADARERAVQILSAAGGASVGALVKADMGVININPANDTSTSWQGNNDKTSLEKDIFTIVHVTYELD